MPNTSLSRLLRALGDFTTTIFIPYASLSSQYRLSQPKPRRPSQAPATKTARVPGRNSSTAPAPHRAAAARAFLPSNVKTAASLHWFCPSIRTGRRLCSSPDADKKTGGGSCRPPWGPLVLFPLAADYQHRSRPHGNFHHRSGGLIADGQGIPPGEFRPLQGILDTPQGNTLYSLIQGNER